MKLQQRRQIRRGELADMRAHAQIMIDGGTKDPLRLLHG